MALTGCAGQGVPVEPQRFSNTAVSNTSQSGESLNQFLSGNTLVLKGRQRRSNMPYSFAMYLAADGDISARADLGSRLVFDTGRWWIDQNGLLCRKFNKWVRKLPGCYRVSRSGTNVKLKKVSGYGAAKTWGDLVAGNAIVQ